MTAGPGIVWPPKGVEPATPATPPPSVVLRLPALPTPSTREYLAPPVDTSPGWLGRIRRRLFGEPPQ